MGDDDEREPFEGIANARLGISGGFGKKVFAVLNRLGQGDRTSMSPSHAPYEHAFAEACSRRFREYIAILLAVFAVMIVDWIAGRAAAFQTYGLVFDLIGALALARGVIQEKRGLQRTTASSLAPQLPGTPVNVEELTQRSHDSVDGVWGAFFLAVGFSIQIWATVGALQNPFV